MKKYMCANILAVMLLASISVNADNHLFNVKYDNGFSIKGKINGLNDGWVVLAYMKGEKYVNDSSKIDNGNFLFKGTTEFPQLAFLAIAGNENAGELQFFIENNPMEINASKDSLQAATVTGSKTNTEFEAFKQEVKPFDEKLNALTDSYRAASTNHDKAALDSLDKIYDNIDSQRTTVIEQYIAQHPASYVSAFQTMAIFSYNPDVKQFDATYSSLDNSIKQSVIGKKIKENLDLAKKTNIGMPAPDFSLKDANGKMVSLSSFKGNYVLIDFWASWCGPCRRENPNVVKTYTAYHDKGFTIVGVSLDDDKDAWLKAISNDNLAWTQVSDLKGWSSSAAKIYGIKGIPMNFLLDKNGVIIAKGLRGDDLNNKLAEVIK